MTPGDTPRLTPFPAERPDRLQAPASLTRRGCSLRGLRDADLPWLRDLYASTRADEMAPLPWPATAKRAFLDQQFALQHNHYLSAFGDSDFLAIERKAAPLGRLYLQRVAAHPPGHANGEFPAEYLIVDIALFPQARGSGIGGALIAAAQQRAAAEGCGMRLHVMVNNAGAQRLYERLGFVLVPEGGTPTHRLMRWSAVSADAV